MMQQAGDLFIMIASSTTKFMQSHRDPIIKTFPLQGVQYDISMFNQKFCHQYSRYLISSREEGHLSKRSAIKQWIKKKFQCAHKNVYFFYSGHGNPNGDWAVETEQMPYGDSFCFNEIVSLWLDQRASHTSWLYIFMDSCHSGEWCNRLASIYWNKNLNISIFASCGGKQKATDIIYGGLFSRCLFSCNDDHLQQSLKLLFSGYFKQVPCFINRMENPAILQKQHIKTLSRDMKNAQIISPVKKQGNWLENLPQTKSILINNPESPLIGPKKVELKYKKSFMRIATKKIEEEVKGSKEQEKTGKQYNSQQIKSSTIKFKARGVNQKDLKIKLKQSKILKQIRQSLSRNKSIKNFTRLISNEEHFTQIVAGDIQPLKKVIKQLSIESNKSAELMKLKFHKQTSTTNLLVHNISDKGLIWLPDISTGQTRIEALNCSKNKISQVPIKYFKLPLKSLNAMDNQIKLITIPPLIAKQSKLQEIILNKNPLQVFPTCLLQLRNLRKLSLQQTRLRELPDNMDQLLNLIYLNIADNQIQALPEGLCNIHGLRKIQMQINDIVKLPQNMDNLEELQILYMHLNKIRYLPRTFSQLKQLKIWSLTIMPDSDLSFQSLPVNDLTNLRKIYLEYKKLKGKQHKQFEQLCKSRQIALTMCKVWSNRKNDN